MPRYANVRATALHNLLLRMGFVETRRNHHLHYRHEGLGLRVRSSFGNKEIKADLMAKLSPTNSE